MADATHFACFAAVRGEKLRCLADIVSQTSRSASGASAGMSADGRTRLLPIVVVANTRDAVDAATSAVLAVAPRARVARLHSDQSADERAAIMEGFRAASSVGLDDARLDEAPARATDANGEKKKEWDDDDARGGRLVVLLAADACLPSVAAGEAPLHAAALVSLDAPRAPSGGGEAVRANSPTTAYRRRVRAALGAGRARVAVCIVAADERRFHEAATLGLEVTEAPFDLHDIVVAKWRASSGKRGKDSRV